MALWNICVLKINGNAGLERISGVHPPALIQGQIDLNS